MSRRHSRNVLLSAGLVLVAFLAIHRRMQRTPFDQPHFEQLQAGMTGREVEQILGGPARNEFRERVTVWLPKGDTKVSYELLPMPQTPSFFPGAGVANEQRLWVGKEGLIAVFFDTEGRLVDKYYSDVHVASRPSAMETVKHVMGL